MFTRHTLTGNTITLEVSFCCQSTQQATDYASADEHWPTYQATNLAFAKRIVEAYHPGDLIWVPSYHLLLVPKLVR